MFAIFRLFRLMNLLDSHAGLIFVYAGSMCIFSIWNMKGYFDSIPIEIEEASRIDGAGNLQLIVRIILPLADMGICKTVLLFIFPPNLSHRPQSVLIPIIFNWKREMRRSGIMRIPFMRNCRI